MAIKALSDPSLVHIFGNTTLEFPLTIEYAQRYRKNHPQSIFKTAENREQVFKDVCEDIGPPARMMRWCCSMFKTGPITRVINSLYRDQRILTFYGIRKSESVSRSKYNRVEDDAESVKIQQQTVASPIFFWKDMDIWLYILAEKIDFNDAYRLGYDRVGCWCCPNNNQRAQFLSRISLPVDAFISELSDYNAAIYSEFEEVYPKLTSGSIFNPFVGFDVVELYESVVKSLKQRGYLGIYVVYDEFSKFLESNITAASVSDTKMLQDFAEKCNRSGENELHLLLISHKEISNYIDQLPKAKVDGWRGVSERFRHIQK